MRETDGRKLDHKTLEQLRIRAVQRVQAGESPEVVIKALGLSRPRIYEWLAAFREGGYEALKAKQLFGRPPKLSGKQLDKLYVFITACSPRQLQFEFALWTRALVRELIRREFGVRLTEVSVGRLLRNLGLTPQKPLYRAYQQNPEAVERWKREEYPAIRKLAQEVGATIYFGDEASVRSDYHSGTTWAPQGKTPVVKSTGARFGLNLMSAVSPKGELRFRTREGKLNADGFIDFLKALLVGADKPIFLIVDNHPVHRAKRVRDFVEGTAGQLKLFYLPSYSPELNPDESVWAYLKHHKLGKMTIQNKDQLKVMVMRYLRSLQKLPKLIRSFFLHPELAYISAN